MPRLLWKGAISVGLLHAPVALYPASKRDDIEFELLDRRTLAPLGYRRINKETGEPVEKEETVKGYQYEEGHYVILSDEEIRAAHVQSTHSVDIFAFIQAQEISFLYFDTPYYLAPAPGGEKVCALLREALYRAKKIALAYVVIQTRQHLAALIPVGQVLVLNTLRWASEVRSPNELPLPADTLKTAEPTEKEIAMALQLMENMTQIWNPAQYQDTFRDDIMALIQRKIKMGHAESVVEIPPVVPQESISNDIDLTDILKKSLHTLPNNKSIHQKKISSSPPHKNGHTRTGKLRRDQG